MEKKKLTKEQCQKLIYDLFCEKAPEIEKGKIKKNFFKINKKIIKESGIEMDKIQM